MEDHARYVNPLTARYAGAEIADPAAYADLISELMV